MTMANNFVTWLTTEMETHGWNNSELARHAGLVPSAVSQVITGSRHPGPDFCQSLAQALSLPPETVFRRAGLLPELQGPEEDARFGELLDVVRNLSADEREEVLRYALFRYTLEREKANSPGSPRTRPASPGAASTK